MDWDATCAPVSNAWILRCESINLFVLRREAPEFTLRPDVMVGADERHGFKMYACAIMNSVVLIHNQTEQCGNPSQLVTDSCQKPRINEGVSPLAVLQSSSLGLWSTEIF